MIRTIDLAAIPLRALPARNMALYWAALDDVLLGCANLAGERIASPDLLPPLAGC